MSSIAVDNGLTQEVRGGGQVSHWHHRGLERKPQAPYYGGVLRTA